MSLGPDSCIRNLYFFIMTKPESSLFSVVQRKRSAFPSLKITTADFVFLRCLTGEGNSVKLEMDEKDNPVPKIVSFCVQSKILSKQMEQCYIDEAHQTCISRMQHDSWVHRIEMYIKGTEGTW